MYYTLRKRPPTRLITWDDIVGGYRRRPRADTIIRFHRCVTQEGQITVMNSSNPCARSNDSKYGYNHRHSPPRFVPLPSVSTLRDSPSPFALLLSFSRSITSCRFFYLEEGLAARANRSNDLANEIISPGEKFETRANFFPARNSISLVARFGVPLSDPAPLNFDCIAPPR